MQYTTCEPLGIGPDVFVDAGTRLGQVYSKETIKENWTKLIVALAIMSRANEESATKSKRAREVI